MYGVISGFGFGRFAWNMPQFNLIEPNLNPDLHSNLLKPASDDKLSVPHQIMVLKLFIKHVSHKLTLLCTYLVTLVT